MFEAEENMTYDQFQQELRQSEYSVLYFQGKGCSVCHALLPKIENLVKSRFPEVKLHVIDLQEDPEISGQLCVFTVPFILVFNYDKECARIRGNNALTIIEKEIRHAIEK